MVPVSPAWALEGSSEGLQEVQEHVNVMIKSLSSRVKKNLTSKPSSAPSSCLPVTLNRDLTFMEQLRHL